MALTEKPEGSKVGTNELALARSLKLDFGFGSADVGAD